jgi:leader peptidase (prepilin peptidase) / N-methyltransferase
MYYLFYILIFIFGLIIGSFLNALIYRLKVGKKVIYGRSFCPFCKKSLGFWDLIPIASFIFLRGRCRYCRKKISWQYPLVELSTGLIFVLILHYQFLQAILVHRSLGEGESYQLLAILFYLFISSVLILIFVYDLKHSIIPNKVILPAIGVSLIYWLSATILYLCGYKQIFYQLYPNIWPLVSNPWLVLLGAIVAGGFFMLLVLVSRGLWMGGGDIKIAILAGLILGFPQVILALFIAFISGALVGLFLIILKKKTLKSQVPFGPFLVLGIFVALFWGSNIVNWYIKALLK